MSASISIHEWGHWFAFNCLGYKKGYVIFTIAGGMFITKEEITNPIHLFIIGISGGMSVAFIFGVLYLCLDWETDEIEKQLLRNYILYQSIYAIVEGLYAIGLFDFDVLSTISIVVYPIFFYATLIYICIKTFKGYYIEKLKRKINIKRQT